MAKISRLESNRQRWSGVSVNPSRKMRRLFIVLSASFGVLLMFAVITLINSAQFTKSLSAYKFGQAWCPVLNAPSDTGVIAATASLDILRSPVRPEVSKVAKGTPHEYLNIFNASKENTTEKNSINSNKCVPLKTSVGDTPICVYDPSIDKWVSGSIVNGGMWEKHEVDTVASFLVENPNMQLLDIGCNIGVFTLQAAKMGRKVMAIDANKFNLRLLSKSLDLGKLQSNVTLLWNAVSDVHETIKLTITTGNIGGSFVKPERDLDPNANPKYNKQTALAITLEDLISFFSGVPLFIKMDIEGSEWRALRGGERFFQKVDVRYISMEWMSFKNTDNARDIIEYMASFGFQPYAVNKNLQSALVLEKSKEWPNNVLWVKR